MTFDVDHRILSPLHHGQCLLTERERDNDDGKCPPSPADRSSGEKANEGER